MKRTILHCVRFFPGLCIFIVLLFPGEAYPQTFAKKIIDAGYPITTVQSGDGGYVSVTRIEGSIYLVRKTNSSGTRVWEKILDFDFGHPTGIAQTAEGGYALVGSQGESVASGILVRLGPGGNIRSKKTFQDSNFTWFTSVDHTSNGGFIVAGKGCASPQFIGCNKYNTIFVRFNSSGSVVWEKAFSNLAPEGGLGLGNLQIVSASDSGFLAAVQKSNGIPIIKVDESGNLLWKEQLEIDQFVLSSTAATSDGGLIVTGRCNVPACSRNFFLIKLNNNGQIAWKKRFAFDVPIQSISDVTQTSDGGYLVTGTARKSFLFKVNSSGNVVFTRQFVDLRNKSISLFSTTDGGFLLFGSTPFTLSSFGDLIIWKLTSDGINDCVSSGSFQSSSVPFGNLKITNPQIDTTNLSLRASSFNVTSTPSQKEVSTTCP